MADNTLQFRWIVTLQGGLDALFAAEPSVFVAGDLLWYPVEGKPKVCQAPDVMVVFGRPKGDRGSYKQWEEENVAPQVVFEILSPGNGPTEMARKSLFYDRYGVEEYYIYDPDDGELSGWLREQGGMRALEAMHGWVSPRLKVRFELANGELRVFGPDNRPFASYVEIMAQREQAERQAAKNAEAADRLRQQLKALGVEPDA